MKSSVFIFFKFKMSLRSLIIGDPHFKVNNAPDTDAMSKKILELAKARLPDVIICLGDVLDRHESIHLDAQDRAVEFLHDLSLIAPLIVLIGNHDRPNNSNYLTTRHPFRALKYWPQTTIVDVVKTIEIKGYKFILVPYVPNGRFQEAICTIWGEVKLGDEKEKARGVFCEGEDYGNFWTSRI